MDALTVKTRGDYTDLRVVFRPLFLLLKILGLITTPNANQVSPSQKNNPDDKKANRNLDYLWRIYSAVMVLILWIIVAKSIMGIFIGDPEVTPGFFTNRIAAAGQYLQAALEMVVLFRMFHCKDRYQKFLRDWCAYTKCMSSCGCYQEKLVRKLRRRFLIFFVFLIFGILGSGAAYFGGMFGPSIEARIGMELFVDPMKKTDTNKIITGIAMLLVSLIWFTTMALFVSTSKALSCQFEALADGLHIMVSRSPESYPTDLSLLRQAHVTLCDLVGTVEKDFKHLLAFSYLLNTIVSMFLGYYLVKSKIESLNSIIMVFWLMINIMKLCVFSLSSTDLHDKAQEPFAILFKINPKRISLEEATHLNMFIQKLQSTSIGFTVWDFMLVRRETILTLVGVFLTYFFILVQFNIPV